MEEAGAGRARNCRPLRRWALQTPAWAKPETLTLKDEQVWESVFPRCMEVLAMVARSLGAPAAGWSGGVWTALVVAALPFSGAVAGEAPQVQFDVPRLVACREVPPEDPHAVQPGHKLVEVVLEVSLLVTRGDARQVREVFYRVESPRQSWEVVDYLPRTITTSSLAGPVAVETRHEAQGQLGGQGRLGWAAPSASVQLTAGVQNKQSRLFRYELLPPQQVVAAAGTIQRRGGVYFKLRPHPQFPLEGTRQLVLLLQVPQSWRADWLVVHCQVLAESRGLLGVLDRQVVCHQRSYAVGLYLYGDSLGAAVVDRFLLARRRWLQQVQEHRKRIAEKLYPGRLASWNVRLPWEETPSAEHLAQEALRRWQARVPEDLPPALAAALVNYRGAAKQLQGLNLPR